LLRYLLTRIGFLLPTFVGVTLLTFALIRLVPGDPIELLVGERGIDPARHAQLRADLGLDEPLLSQYLTYIGNVLQGDLGRSIVTKTPVLDEFLALFPATVELSICAIAFAVIAMTGIPPFGPSKARMAFVAATPSISGIWTSIRTISYCWVLTALMASMPFATESTRCPARVRITDATV